MGDVKVTKMKSDEQKKQDAASKRVKTLIGGNEATKTRVLALRESGKKWTEIETELSPQVALKQALGKTTPVEAAKSEPVVPAPTPAPEPEPIPAPQPVAAQPVAKLAPVVPVKLEPLTPNEKSGERVKMKNRIREAIANSQTTDALGYLVWSAINQKLIIDREQFEKIVEEEGLAELAPAPNLRDRSAFRKALHAAEESGLVRKIREDRNQAVYALVSEDKDKANDKVDFAQEETAYYNKETRTFDTKGGKYGAKIKEAFERFLSVYNHNDIRAWVIQTLREGCNAIVVRDHGGVYFLPPAYKDLLERMDRVMQRVDPETCLSIVGLQGTGREQQDIGRVAVLQLKAQIAGMAERLTNVFDAENGRKSTLEARLADFRRYREQLLVYKDILMFESSDIEKVLADSEKQLQARIAAF